MTYNVFGGTLSLTQSVGQSTTDVYISVLDAVPPVYVVSNRVATDKLTTANGGTFNSSSASLSSQSRYSTSVTDRAICNVIGYCVWLSSK